MMSASKEIEIRWSLPKRLIRLQSVNEQYNVVKFKKRKYVVYMACELKNDNAIQSRCNLLSNLLDRDFDIFPHKKDGFTIFKIHLN